MTQAARWQSIVAPMVPVGAPLLHAIRARWLLDEAAVWQTNTGHVGVLWQFEDGSHLCANECRDWVIVRTGATT